MIREQIRIAVAGLVANKLRSALTILGMTIGVASVIVLISVGTGSSHAVQQRIQALGTNVLLVTRGNWFLESLLRADEQITFDQLTPDAFQPEQAAGFDAVILDDFLPSAFRALSTLPVGNFLFLRRAPWPGAGGAARGSNT